MKIFKRLLAGFIIVVLILLGVFAWLWISNQTNSNPLPILYDDSAQQAAAVKENADTQANSTLYLQATASMQVPLDNVIVRFESRYPKMQILARYVAASALLNLPNASDTQDSAAPLVINTDMIIADDKLNQSQLNALQSVLKQTQLDDQRQAKTAVGSIKSETVKDKMQDTIETNNTVNKAPSVASNSDEVRHLVSFSYALKDEQYLDGVILTDNPTAVTFRNFLLSSTGQDILKQYDYDNIDGYKSSVDDLFNPTTRGKATNDMPSKVTEVLNNGK